MPTEQATKLVYDEIRDELRRAMNTFPPFNSGHEGYAFIAEEVHELWLEVMKKQSTPGRAAAMRKEALQVAAMAYRFILDLPHFKN